MVVSSKSDIDHAANSEGFGSPLEEYTSDRSQIVGSVIFMVLFFLLGALILSLLVVPNPKEKNPLAWRIAAAIVGGAFVGYGLLMLKRILGSRSHVVVYPEGLVVACKGKVQTCRWIDTTSVTRNVLGSTPLSASLYGPPEMPVFKKALSVGRDYCCVIQGKDGQCLHLTSFLSKLENLTTQIEDKVCQRLLPALRQQVDEGSSISFGPITVEPGGLRRGKQVVVWREVQEVKVDPMAGRVFVQRSGQASPWLNLPTVKMPNSAVFVALVSQLRAGRTAEHVYGPN